MPERKPISGCRGQQSGLNSRLRTAGLVRRAEAAEAAVARAVAVPEAPEHLVDNSRVEDRAAPQALPAGIREWETAVSRMSRELFWLSGTPITFIRYIAISRMTTRNDSPAGRGARFVSAGVARRVRRGGAKHQIDGWSGARRCFCRSTNIAAPAAMISQRSEIQELREPTA